MASNESGNDTAAFQVGDRVRFDWFGTEHEGVLAALSAGVVVAALLVSFWLMGR